MTTATATKRHDGSNRKACSMCGQRRGSWKSDNCGGATQTRASGNLRCEDCGTTNPNRFPRSFGGHCMRCE